MFMHNTSGHGEFAQVPEEIKGWNWGAFFLSIIWGLGNCTYIALLGLLPIANLIMPFYLGAKGNELAWRNKRWKDIEEFRATQRAWSIAGWTVTAVLLIFLIITAVHNYQDQKKVDALTEQVMGIIQENEEIRNLLGDQPVVLFEPMVMEVQTNRERRPLSYTVYLQGTKGVVTINASLGPNMEIESITVSIDDQKMN